MREWEGTREGKKIIVMQYFNFGITCRILFTFVTGIPLSNCITQARDRELTSVDMDEDYEIPDSIQHLYNDARILKVTRMCDLLCIQTVRKAHDILT